MLSDLFRTIVGDEPNPARTPLSPSDARLALTAILVRIAKSDHHYARRERDLIDRIVAKRYDLAPDEAEATRAQAEDLEERAPDTVRFTRAVKDAVPYEERRCVIRAAWSVVLADGTRTHEEDSLMRMVASLLGVSDVHSALERQAAERDRDSERPHRTSRG